MTQDFGKPETIFKKYSEYALSTAKVLPKLMAEFLEPLPIERIEINENFNPTEAHIQGTTVMGISLEDSVVDRNCLHHSYRNLFILGSSVFPNCAPANPTLTLSALSLMAAKSIFV